MSKEKLSSLRKFYDNQISISDEYRKNNISQQKEIEQLKELLAKHTIQLSETLEENTKLKEQLKECKESSIKNLIAFQFYLIKNNCLVEFRFENNAFDWEKSTNKSLYLNNY